MQSKKILAVDPGFDRIGLAIMKLEKDRPKILFSQCFKTDSKKAVGKEFEKWLRQVLEEDAEILDELAVR